MIGPDLIARDVVMKRKHRHGSVADVVSEEIESLGIADGTSRRKLSPLGNVKNMYYATQVFWHSRGRLGNWQRDDHPARVVNEKASTVDRISNGRTQQSVQHDVYAHRGDGVHGMLSAMFDRWDSALAAAYFTG